MKKPNIIIEVRGGLVQEVYADSPVNVKVLDWDSLDSGSSDEEMEEIKQDCLELEAETKKMKSVW